MKLLVSLLLTIWLVNFLAVARKNIKLKGKEKEISFSEEEILSVNSSTKGLNRIKNADNYGKGPQQVLFTYRGGYWCTGTMLTNSIMITAGHCVANKSPGDLRVHLPDDKCNGFGNDKGIPVCKIESNYKDTGNCGSESHDIALVRLSRPMPGMGNLRRDFYSPRVGDRTVMAGTGANNHNTCRSLISYQTVTSCGCGSKFYAQREHTKRLVGPAVGILADFLGPLDGALLE
eukprot:TRINITY_DN8494_c0_g1_i1.p1 TRINITY_DN8494_c0_g1~~TRINITY_DN8494_c0_g1_i1.p1  ORF type:complete len:232 (-),score=15.45 TRINITY_DN8494_c0_g1_i1:215-910(-)